MRFVLDILGLFVAVIGAASITRDKPGSFRPLHILINELPWVPSLFGTLLAVLGLRRRRKPWAGILLGGAGILLGGVGALLASNTFLRWRAATDDMESAFKAGFGKDYLERIPPVARERLPSKRVSLGNSLGGSARRDQGKLIRDIEFARPDGHSLYLDVYKPSVPPAIGDQYPAVIVIHGGGWRNGDKYEYFESHSRHLAAQGYVVFDIQYRLAPTTRWPGQLEDVKAAIRWVKKHADDYQLDPESILLLGRSAGAHLALMVVCCPDEDTRIRGVVSVYGPTELRWEGLAPDSPIIELMGGPYESLKAAYETQGGLRNSVPCCSGTGRAAADPDDQAAWMRWCRIPTVIFSRVAFICWVAPLHCSASRGHGMALTQFTLAWARRLPSIILTDSWHGVPMPPKDITETIYSAPLPRRPETGLLAWQATIGYINLQYNLDARLELMVQPKEADQNWSAAAEWGQNHEESTDEPTIGAALRELWNEISRKHIIFASREAVARKPAGYADDEWLDKETSLLLSRLLDAARLVYKTEWRLKRVAAEAVISIHRTAQRPFSR